MSAKRQPRFYINDPKKFDVVSPSFDEPTEIGYFSLDIMGDFAISKKSLRYFIRPENPERVKFDLRKGYDTMIKNTSEREKETHLFKWIMENMDTFSNEEDENSPRDGASGSDKPVKCTPPKDTINVDQELACLQTGLDKLNISTKEDPQSPIATQRNNRRLDTDFVCRRGLLTEIMCSPYEQRDDWLIAVTLHNGTYYLNEIKTEKKRQEEADMDDEMSCWGTKFEEYITADSRDGKPNPDKQYNNCEGFYIVVRTKLNDHHSLLFSGEVDALNAEKESNTYYMQFKTHRQGSDNTFKRFKIKKWWAQNHLLGIKEIVCGFRDDEWIVHNLKFYKTSDLPRLAQSSWKSKVCLNALDKFLSHIKASITTDDHRIVHTLKWSPGGQPVLCSGPFRDSEYNFLPAWYTDVVN